MYKVGDNIVVFEDKGKMAVSITDPYVKQQIATIPNLGTLESGDVLMVLLPLTRS